MKTGRPNILILLSTSGFNGGVGIYSCIFDFDTFKNVSFRYSWEWLLILGSFWHFWGNFDKSSKLGNDEEKQSFFFNLLSILSKMKSGFCFPRTEKPQSGFTVNQIHSYILGGLLHSKCLNLESQIYKKMIF